MEFIGPLILGWVIIGLSSKISELESRIRILENFRDKADR